MDAQILGSGVLGVAAILILGGLLALGAYYLPQLLKLGEAAGLEGKWGLGEPGAGLLRQAEPAPVLPPREPLAARLGAGEEDDLVAAAIALALSLYQTESPPPRQVVSAAAGGSPWAWSGRWQAMQARLQRQQKR